MLCLLGAVVSSLRSALRTRTDLALENLALRQQLAALRQQVGRPQVRFADRLFWAWLHRFWGRWREALILVRPETVIRWHRRGFKRYWTWRSRRRGLQDGPYRRHRPRRGSSETWCHQGIDPLSADTHGSRTHRSRSPSPARTQAPDRVDASRADNPENRPNGFNDLGVDCPTCASTSRTHTQRSSPSGRGGMWIVSPTPEREDGVGGSRRPCWSRASGAKRQIGE